MSPHIARAIYAIHRWCGLVIGVNLLILSVTAIYLLAYRASWFIFNDTGAAWTPPPLIDEQRRLPIQPVLDQLAPPLAQAGIPLRSVSPARQEGDKNVLTFHGAAETALRIAMEPYTGTLTLETGVIPHGAVLPLPYVVPTPPEPALEPKQPTFAAWLADWMLTLHADLFLGDVGKFFVGIIGVLFLISMITGLIIYAPFMKSLAFGQLRRRRWRFLLADAHKLIGITTLMFNLIIALTGIGITLGVLIIPWHQTRQLAGLAQAPPAPVAARPSIDTVITAAQASRAEWHIFDVAMPAAPAHPGHYVVRGASQPGWQDITPLITTVDAATATRATVIPRPWWVSAIIIGAPMHYGNFAGMWARLVYLALTLATAALSLSGFALYIMKKKRLATIPEAT